MAHEEIEKGSVVESGKPETLLPSGKTQAGNRSKQLGQTQQDGPGDVPTDGSYVRFSGGKLISNHGGDI